MDITWWSQWTQLVLLVKAAAASFYMSCKSHRYWIYSQLLGPLTVTRLKFHWSFDFPAAEVDIVPCKGELAAEARGLVTCQSGSGMPKGPRFLIALCHPSSWGKGNFKSQQLRWLLSGVSLACQLTLTEQNEFLLKFFCLNERELVSSKFITSIQSSISLRVCEQQLWATMVFDESNFPYFTINLETFFAFFPNVFSWHPGLNV